MFDRPHAGATGVLGGLRRLTRLGEVVGQRGQVDVLVRHGFERVADPPVQTAAPRRAELGQQRLTDEVVGERVVGTRLDDQARALGFVEGVEQRVGIGRDVGEAGEQQRGEGRSHHRAHAQHAVGGVGQP